MCIQLNFQNYQPILPLLNRKIYQKYKSIMKSIYGLGTKDRKLLGEGVYYFRENEIGKNIKSAINVNTKAIILVHALGFNAINNQIIKIAKEKIYC